MYSMVHSDGNEGLDALYKRLDRLQDELLGASHHRSLSLLKEIEQTERLIAETEEELA